MSSPNLNISIRPRIRSLLLVLLLSFHGSQLQAQTQSPQLILAAMERCREQVISQLSFSDKMMMRAAMGAVQSTPQFIAANNAVTNAPTLEAQIVARKALAKVKLDLIAKQDPSLKPVVEKIRLAQTALLH
jgi:hypothetical protein